MSLYSFSFAAYTRHAVVMMIIKIYLNKNFKTALPLNFLKFWSLFFFLFQSCFFQHRKKNRLTIFLLLFFSNHNCLMRFLSLKDSCLLAIQQAAKLSSCKQIFFLKKQSSSLLLILFFLFTLFSFFITFLDFPFHDGNIMQDLVF